MKRLLLLFAILTMVVGCKNAHTTTEPVKTPLLEVDKSEYLLDYSAQELVVTLRTNQVVEVETSENWIMATMAESGDSVVLYLLENKGSEARTAEVMLKAGDLSLTLTITQGVKPESMHLTLGHTSQHLDSPEWGGSNVKGSVDWGDGTTAEYYDGISHDYADAQKRDAKFKMEGATSFSIARVGDIESITISL